MQIKKEQENILGKLMKKAEEKKGNKDKHASSKSNGYSSSLNAG